MIRLAGAFEWSANEQVYTLEKSLVGGTLYAKQISIGSLPNAGVKTTNHNIVGFDSNKIHSMSGIALVSGSYALSFPVADGAGVAVYLSTNATEVYIKTTSNMTAYTAFVRLIYWK